MKRALRSTKRPASYAEDSDEMEEQPSPQLAKKKRSPPPRLPLSESQPTRRSIRVLDAYNTMSQPLPTPSQFQSTTENTGPRMRRSIVMELFTTLFFKNIMDRKKVKKGRSPMEETRIRGNRLWRAFVSFIICEL